MPKRTIHKHLRFHAENYTYGSDRSPGSQVQKRTNIQRCLRSSLNPYFDSSDQFGNSFLLTVAGPRRILPASLLSPSGHLIPFLVSRFDESTSLNVADALGVCQIAIVVSRVSYILFFQKYFWKIRFCLHSVICL